MSNATLLRTGEIGFAIVILLAVALAIISAFAKPHHPIMEDLYGYDAMTEPPTRPFDQEID